MTDHLLRARGGERAEDLPCGGGFALDVRGSFDNPVEVASLLAGHGHGRIRVVKIDAIDVALGNVNQALVAKVAESLGQFFVQIIVDGENGSARGIASDVAVALLLAYQQSLLMPRIVHGGE